MYFEIAKKNISSSKITITHNRLYFFIGYYNMDMDSEDSATSNAKLDGTLDLFPSRKTIIAIYDEFDSMPLPDKIKVSKEKEDYLCLEIRFKDAVDMILATNSTSSNLLAIAKDFELDPKVLQEEINCFKSSGAEVYEYNASGRIFSYKEELALLEVLATISRAYCICQTCTLARLLVLAYHMARRKDKSYPCEWDINQQADEEWLTNFKIEYEYELSNSFPENCAFKIIRELKKVDGTCT